MNFCSILSFSNVIVVTGGSSQTAWMCSLVVHILNRTCIVMRPLCPKLCGLGDLHTARPESVLVQLFFWCSFCLLLEVEMGTVLVFSKNFTHRPTFA